MTTDALTVGELMDVLAEYPEDMRVQPRNDGVLMHEVQVKETGDVLELR